MAEIRIAHLRRHCGGCGGDSGSIFRVIEAAKRAKLAERSTIAVHRQVAAIDALQCIAS